MRAIIASSGTEMKTVRVTKTKTVRVTNSIAVRVTNLKKSLKSGLYAKSYNKLKKYGNLVFSMVLTCIQELNCKIRCKKNHIW